MRGSARSTMSPVKIDYSLYLVTGRDLLPEGKDYYESLEESLQGGVTVVQVREKDVDTGEFVEIARRTKEITDKYNIPLLINDRVDVHLAIGSAGVHVGQTDMPIDQVRALIGPDAVLGLSCGSVAQAEAAVRAGVDYIGIGAVWHTVSKDLKGKESLGPEGVGEILDVLEGTGVQSVAIGGIHLPNLAHLMHSSISPKHAVALNGIAIISDIVSSPTPKKAAEDLQSVLKSFFTLRETKAKSRQVFGILAGKRSPEELLAKVGEIMQVVRRETPMINQLTNNVVINDSANATLAVGASPIMATHPRDVKDLSRAIGALLVNFGTITDKEGMLVAGREANVNRRPVVFDPVAVGATAHRREVSKLLLSHWQPTVIKGNAAEIGALAKSAEVATRGVDSVGSGFKDPANVVRELARKRAAIIVLTGVTDYISDGETVLKVSNGHELLGVITGSGCMTGTLVACFCAGARLHHLASVTARSDAQLVQGDMLVGALAGVLAMTIAAEVAAARPDVKGPGTFRAALLDELYTLTPQVVLDRANVEIVA